MGWKKLIFGEKMPDKDDPKYEKRYKKEVEAGRKAARFLRIDKMAGCAQRFACKHPKWFLGIVFGIVLGCLAHLMCIAWYRYAYYRTMAGTPRPPNGRRFF